MMRSFTVAPVTPDGPTLAASPDKWPRGFFAPTGTGGTHSGTHRRRHRAGRRRPRGARGPPRTAANPPPGSSRRRRRSSPGSRSAGRPPATRPATPPHPPRPERPCEAGRCGRPARYALSCDLGCPRNWGRFKNFPTRPEATSSSGRECGREPFPDRSGRARTADPTRRPCHSRTPSYRSVRPHTRCRHSAENRRNPRKPAAYRPPDRADEPSK